MENTNANDNSISESNVNNTNRDGGWTTSSGQSVSDLMSDISGTMNRFASEGHDNTDYYNKDTGSSSAITAPAQTQAEQVEQTQQPKTLDLSYIDVELERSSSPTEMQVEAAPVAQPVDDDEEEEKSDVLANAITPVKANSSKVAQSLEEAAKDSPMYAQSAESNVFSDEDPFAGFTTNKPKKTDVEELKRTATAADEYKAANDKTIEAGKDRKSVV